MMPVTTSALDSMSEQTLPAYHIADIPIAPAVTLAPMAGHTNLAFRRLVREQGACGLVCTEVMSSAALDNKGTREQSLQVFNWLPEEFPFAVQLFGSDPGVIAEAARIVVDHGARIVDINMGCWVPKIAKRGAGAALMRDVCNATAVVEAVVRAVDVPVTVKVRSGFEEGVITAVPFARAAERVGVQAVAVHARFAGQAHNGDADWEVIRQVKEAVDTLPVIGNGDIHTGPDARRMLDQTGCDGVMVGRGALGKPWVFQQIAHYLATGQELPDPPRAERAALALRHAQYSLEHINKREEVIIRELRGQISKYGLDEAGSVRVRNRLVRVETMRDVEAILLPIIHAED